MGARDRELAIAVRTLLDGASFDVVGGRGAGRSHFLRAVGRAMAEREWTVLEVRGIASLREHPLTVLHLAGFGSAREPRPLSSLLVSSADALVSAIRPGRTVLLVDDWDDLDESSWGVIEAARKSAGLQTVVSRLQGMPARHTPTGLPASTLEPAFAIDLLPLRQSDIETIIEERLGGPASSELGTRVFQRSGGIVGLAIDMVTAARREDRIARQDGVWAPVRDLWSPSMRAVLDAHLESLTGTQRDSLELIALIGAKQLDTVRKIVPWRIIEHLEERVLIRVFMADTRRVVVHPPMLQDYFRHEPLSARRVRLTRTALKKLNVAEAQLSPSPTGAPGAVREEAALFLTVVEDQANRELAVAEAEFRNAPSPATALASIHALHAVGAPAAAIQAVFDDIPPQSSGARDIDLVRLDVARASWVAAQHDDLPAAHRILARAGASGGAAGRLADAAAVQLDARYGSIPADFVDRLKVTDDLPGPVRAVLVETKMTMLAALGEFDAATDRFDLLEDLEKADLGFAADAVVGLIDLGMGQFDEAMAFARRRYQEAIASLDTSAVRGFASLLTLGHTLQGDYAQVESVLGTVLAVCPRDSTGSEQVALRVAGVLAAVRRGRPELARRYQRELQALRAPDGILPGQHRAWATAQLHLEDGRVREAALVLREAADELWERGGRFAAALAYLTAHEIDPRPERLPEDLARARQVEGRLVGAHADYLEALGAFDSARLIGLADELVAVGRPGLAVSGLRHAGDHVADDSRAAVRELLDALVAGLPPGLDDHRGMLAPTLTLTERDKRILGHLAAGLSNGQIAEAEHVSIRTIEGANGRLARTLRVDGRQGLIDWALRRRAGEP